MSPRPERGKDLSRVAIKNAAEEMGLHSGPRGGSGWDGVELRCANYSLAHWRKLALATWGKLNGTVSRLWRGDGTGWSEEFGAQVSHPHLAEKIARSCRLWDHPPHLDGPQTRVDPIPQPKMPVVRFPSKSGFFFCWRSRIRF